MKYNLTPSQQELARGIVEQVRAGNLPETFHVLSSFSNQGGIMIAELKVPDKETEGFAGFSGQLGQLDTLADAKFLIQTISYEESAFGSSTRQSEHGRTCTLTAAIYKAVDSNFAEEETANPVSTLAQPHPPEIAMSLDRLREKYPDAKKVGFLVMRFTAAKPFAKIVEIIKQVGEQHGLKIIRADENEFHADLWGNVRTHLHGCGFGIAIYERIETNEPNANVGLEVGYLMAMNKPVLLLKDKTVETLQADLAGKLYKQFDPHDPEGTIPTQLTKWLEDYGIVVPKHP